TPSLSERNSSFANWSRDMDRTARLLLSLVALFVASTHAPRVHAASDLSGADPLPLWLHHARFHEPQDSPFAMSASDSFSDSPATSAPYSSHLATAASVAPEEASSDADLRLKQQQDDFGIITGGTSGDSGDSGDSESRGDSGSSSSSSSSSSSGSDGRRSYSNQVYTVYMRGLPPIVSYTGGVPGFEATASAAATADADADVAAVGTTEQNPTKDPTRPDPKAPHVVAYTQQLASLHSHTIASIGLSSSDLLYSYTYLSNAFCVSLTPSQLHRLKRHPAVDRIEPSRSLAPLTTITPAFLNLTSVVWKGLGGANRAGENVIIGVVDSGIWPEHPAFSGRGYLRPKRTWRGKCAATKDFKATSCNNKIIAAQFFSAAYLKANKGYPKGEYASPRDSTGHGTWCAGAAAGNSNIQVRMSPRSRVIGRMSGMAPRARVAVYKAVWGGESSVGDVMAAVEQAVRDGVDVLLLPIGSTDDDYFNSAFLLRAVQAGVFVVAAAGNEGMAPGAKQQRTLANVSPYIFTVAASGVPREWQAKVTLGDGKWYTGITQQGGDLRTTTNLPLVDAKMAGTAKALPQEAEQCRMGTLDPAKVIGAAVLCWHGGVSLEEKALTVQTAGGKAVLLVVQSPRQYVRSVTGAFPGVTFGMTISQAIKDYLKNDSNTKVTFGMTISQAIKDYLKNDSNTKHHRPRSRPPLLHQLPLSFCPPSAYPFPSSSLHFPSHPLPCPSRPTVSISPILYTLPKGTLAPVMAYFSSSGPPLDPWISMPKNPTVTNEILKPDITAPGLALLSSTNAGNAASPGFKLDSGTSAAASVAAGVAALLIQKYPRWTPGMVKSAIMTTASVKDMWGKGIRSWDWTYASPWQFGSGHITPGKSINPGLVYDVRATNYINFLAGLDEKKAKAAFPAAVFSPIETYNLNQPNIAIGRIKKTLNVTRWVTNVEFKTSTYKLYLVKPDGVSVSVTPSKLTLRPGQRAAYNVTIVPKAIQKNFTFGSITWKDGVHEVRSVLAVQPIEVKSK
ncbi:unnamed protein product, partial [Closterium sp. NIES-53]